jgi:hypothetical protein
MSAIGISADIDQDSVPGFSGVDGVVNLQIVSRHSDDARHGRSRQ